MKKGIFIAAAVLLSTIACGQQADTSATKLDEVIVTPNKFQQKQSETGKVVTLITQDQIQKNYGKSLAEILNQQTGLTINGADNNLGTNPTVYLRGAASANTLILMDGIPLYDASGISSEFDLNNFPLSNIEKVEILKGAQSTLYGSDAVAGVINIITKKGEGKPLTLTANLSAGSYNTYKGDLALSGKTSGGQTYLLSYSKISSDGISSAYDSTGQADFDKDGFEQDALFMNYGLNFKKLSVNTFAKYNSNRADIDAGLFADDKDFTYHNRNFITGLTSTLQMKNGHLKFQYAYNLFDRKFTDDSTDIGGYSAYQKGKYKGQSHLAEVYATWLPGKGFEVLAGIDYRHNKTGQEYIYIPDYGFPALPISDDSAISRQGSVYASLYFKQQKGFNFEIGGRLNHHNIYGANATYTFNPFYLINNRIKIYSNISSGYRVPSLYQLYSEYGNRNLKSETTTSYEAGVQYSSGKINARATGFLRDGGNIFLFYFDPVTYASQYINADKQHDYGIETEAAFNIGEQLKFRFNYTFVDGKITTEVNGKDSSYFNLYKRPKHNSNLNLSYQPYPSIFISANLKLVSKSFEPQYMSTPYELKGYYKMDLFARYSINRKMSLYADLQNITGREYFVTRGFTTKGFNMQTGIRLQW